MTTTHLFFFCSQLLLIPGLPMSPTRACWLSAESYTGGGGVENKNAEDVIWQEGYGDFDPVVMEDFCAVYNLKSLNKIPSPKSRERERVCWGGSRDTASSRLSSCAVGLGVSPASKMKRAGTGPSGPWHSTGDSPARV